MALFEHFKSVGRDSGAQDPTFLKSTGDGLFCVWEVEDPASRSKRKIEVVRFAMELNEQLAQRLVKDWESQVQFGIGVTYGVLQRYRSLQVRDYFGYYGNLAAKLQDSARPSGVIIDGDYVATDPQTEIVVRERYKLQKRHIASDSPLSQFKVEWCYVSDSVVLAHNWTCLAWPGFANTELSSMHEEREDRSLRLSEQGITVVTHEGLQGKIDSLKISRPNSSGAGKCHIFIDDYDALRLLQRQRLASFFDRRSVHQKLENILAGVAGSFRELCRFEEFAFVPIRCGINAIAATAGLPFDLKSFASYTDLLPHLEGSERMTLCEELIQERERTGVCTETTGIKPSEIGLYDNMGATLPVLLMLVFDKITHRNVYKSEHLLPKLLDELKTLTADGNGFRRYTTIESMARDLRDGYIKLVLGGGAWLVDPFDDSPSLQFHVPRMDGGLLWIEGAALSSDAGESAHHLLDFLKCALLSPEFQRRLGKVEPYPSCPTTKSEIAHLIALTKIEGPISHIAQEASTIFRDETHVQEHLLSIRTTPEKPEVWLETFRTIMNECCRVMTHSGGTF